MIVCQCNGVSDQEIRRVVREGACSVSAVARECGAGACCGGCHEGVREIIGQTAAVGATLADAPVLGLVPSLPAL